MSYSMHRTAISALVLGALLSGCAAKGEETANDTGAVTEEPTVDQPVTAQPTNAADTAATYPGPDQMPATATLTVSGPKPDDGWNGSWTVNSNVSGCGINTYPKMINFDIIDEKGVAGGFEELRIGTNDGPDVGGSTSKFDLTLSLKRPGANLHINPLGDKDHSGTLTILENSKGFSRFKVTARTNRGVQFDGEFTCVPRPTP